MFRLIEKRKIVSASAKLAREFAEMLPCPNDRPVRKAILAMIDRAVTEGTFRSAVWASCYCKSTQQTYRINGKHTSTYLSGLETFPSGLDIYVERYEADTLEDVAKLYATFDSKQSSRNANDINRAFAATDVDMVQLPHRMVSLCVTGMSYNLWEDSYSAHPPDERALLLLDHKDFVLFVWDILSNTDSKHLWRGPVVAAMARTFAKCQRDARSFWEAVRDGSAPDNRSPDRLLERYLNRVSVNTGKGARSLKDKVGSRELFVKCLHAWNAWRRGDSTDLKYYSAAATPAAV